MFDTLQDILIISNSGKVLASKINNPQIEEQLFGMLISALSSYTEGLNWGQLNHLEFSNVRIDFLRKDEIIFVASSSKDIKHKKVLKALKYVSEMFFEKYKDDLLNTWDGSLNIFQDLDNYITKSKDDVFIELVFKNKKEGNDRKKI